MDCAVWGAIQWRRLLSVDKLQHVITTEWTNSRSGDCCALSHFTVLETVQHHYYFKVNGAGFFDPHCTIGLIVIGSVVFCIKLRVFFLFHKFNLITAAFVRHALFFLFKFGSPLK